MSRLSAAVAALLCLTASPARAYLLRPTLRKTFGSRHYSGTYAAVDVGSGDLRVKPSFSDYHSDLSSGTFRTFSVRAAYDWDRYEFGLSGGWTPWVDGYKDHFASGDVMATFPLDEEASPPTRLDIGSSLAATVHSEQLAPNRKGISQDIDIRETNLAGFAALGWRDCDFSVDLAKSVYDKDLSRLSARLPPANFLAGVASTIQGFPDFSGSAKVEFQRWEAVVPYLSYAYTTFRVTQPFAVAYTAGVYVPVGRQVELNASYQRYAQRGSADQNYVTFGASAKF